MRQSAILLLSITFSIVSFSWYCGLLLDLIMNIRTGIYAPNSLEALAKCIAVLAYTYVAFRFIKDRIKIL